MQEVPAAEVIYAFFCEFSVHAQQAVGLGSMMMGRMCLLGWENVCMQERHCGVTQASCYARAEERRLLTSHAAAVSNVAGIADSKAGVPSAASGRVQA